MQRRKFLGTILGGSLGAGACGFQVGSYAARSARDARTSPQLPDLETMAKTVLATSRGDLTGLALEWTRKGAGVRDLLGAAFLAGVHEVNPSPIGGQVHAMMMVASATEVSQVLPGRRSLMPALFNLDRVKHSQSRDERSSRGDWTMPPAPPAERRTRDELAARFDKAMEEWDEPAVDQAVASLHETASLRDFFELLWPWAARDFRIIGHKIIFATQAFRTMQDIGWRHGLHGARSVALGVLDQNPYQRFSDEQTKHILAVHERNRGRCAKFPAGWRDGAADSKGSTELLGRMRGCDADECAEIVLAELGKGTSAATIWDGIRLFAFEFLMQHPGIAGVHGVTSVNALYRTGLYTTREDTRRIVLLQAASWMPMFVTMLSDRKTNDGKVDELRAGEASGDPFDAGSTGEGAARAVKFMADRGLAAFTACAYDVLARKSREDHDYKFAVAAIEEMAAAHPACRPWLAGAAMSFLRNERDDDSTVWTHAREAL